MSEDPEESLPIVPNDSGQTQSPKESTAGTNAQFDLPNFSQSWAKGGTTSKKPLPTNAKIGIGVAVGVVVGALIAGIAVSAHPAVQAVVTSSPLASKSPVTVSSSSPSPTSIVKTSTYDGPLLKQTTSIEAMNNMDYTAFAQLSLADRAAFTIAHANPLGLQPEAWSPSATFKTDVPSIPGFSWGNLLQESSAHFGTQLGAKMISMLYYYTTNEDGSVGEVYDKQAQTFLNFKPDTMLTTQYVFVKAGNEQKEVDRDGNPIDVVDITYNTIDGGINGSGDTTATDTAKVVRSVIEVTDGKNKGKQYVIYSIAYDVAGTNAPDPMYPY